MKINRRGFLAAMAVPLVAKFLPKKVTVPALDFVPMPVHPSQILTPQYKVGDTIFIRRPQRFVMPSADYLAAAERTHAVCLQRLSESPLNHEAINKELLLLEFNSRCILADLAPHSIDRKRS